MEGFSGWFKDVIEWSGAIGPVLVVLTFIGGVIGSVYGIYSHFKNRKESKALAQKAAEKESEDRLMKHIDDIKNDAKEREDRLMNHIKDLKNDAKERESRLTNTIRELRTELKDVRQAKKSR